MKQLYPLVISDNIGYFTLHNDVRLYFRESICLNSNYVNIVNLISSNIDKYQELNVYKYDIIFDLIIDIKDIHGLFELYTPNYIINSIKYQVSIDKLIDQFARTVELLNQSCKLEYIHNLSLVATSISKFIECIRYYEKESIYIEKEMPQNLTLSEKYILDFSESIETVIDDIYILLINHENERGKKLFYEYLSDKVISEILNLDNKLKGEFYQKCGYIYRVFNPDALNYLHDSKNYIDFVSGWLEASTNYVSKEEIRKTFTFKSYDVLSLYNYVSFILQNSQLDIGALECLTEVLSNSTNISIYILAELCSYMILKKMSVDQLQNIIYDQIQKMASISKLDYKVHEISCFFKIYFCLFEYNDKLQWDILYNKTIKNFRISSDSRGHKPALALKELAEKIFNMFYKQNNSYENLLDIAFNLTYFTRMYGTGSCNDCGTYEVLPFLKGIFLSFFKSNPSNTHLSRLCEGIMPIFIENEAYYVDELAWLFYLDGNKTLFLKIVDYWCGFNGVVWKKEYNDIEFVCDKIIELLHKFDEPKLIEMVQTRKQLKLLSYVGHKDYTLNGLLDCYKKLPINKRKLTDFGMKLLTVSDYADEMGDNRITVDDELFENAVELGFGYVHALFEIKNTPQYIVYWRKCLLKALYKCISSLSFNDDQLLQLYRLTNSWINAQIEESTLYGYNDYETLLGYNKQLINLIKDTNLKEILIALGNCEPKTKVGNIDKFEENLEEKYPNVFNTFKSLGYGTIFEKEVLSTYVQKKHSSLNLLLYLKGIMNQDNLGEFTSNCVIPYMHLNNEYGYRSYGHNYLIEELYSYFSREDWIILFKDFSSRFFSTEKEFNYFYSISDDLELLSLYYYLHNHPDKLELMFEERCNMHFSFSNTINVQHKKLIIDPTIQTFTDFVIKQIGKQKYL